MALNLSFGGGDNEYVDAASRAAGGSKGGPSIIASVLDLLGIGKQVAKPPKQGDLADSQTPEAKADKQDSKLQDAANNSDKPVSIPAISEAETALGVQPIPMAPAQVTGTGLSPWGSRYLESLKPLTQIDPDMGILQSKFDQAFKGK